MNNNQSQPSIAQPRWPALVLRMAALYNILWGAWQIVAPLSFFDVMGMEPINHAMVWQGMGMVIGVYGLAYFWASFDYIRHWPIVAVGLLGKVLGPVGYVISDAPASFGYTLITNDLAWWLPFGIMLLHAKRVGFPLRTE